MKKKSVTLLCIVLSIIILRVNVKFINAQEGVNLFDEILLVSKSKVVEYGLKTSFMTKENPKVICNNLIKSLGLNNKEIKIVRSEDEYSYCIEFSGVNIEGYIEGITSNNDDLKNDNENNITINISKKMSENGLVLLKNKVKDSIGRRGKNIKSFEYLKAKIDGDSSSFAVDDINGVNDAIIKILKSRGAKNIDTVSLNNGLSTIAYTKKYDEELINNKLIDFNYAICNYSSGRYIIIGTPEIIITY